MKSRPYKYNRGFFRTLFRNYDQPVHATIRLLNEAGLSVPHELVNESILSHPDYPSLLAISDCLHDLKIENAAVKVDKTQLEEYPIPMLVQTKEGFEIITNVTDEDIELADANGEQVIGNKDAFIQNWNGIALLLDNESIETAASHLKAKQKEIKPRTLPFGTAAILLVTIFIGAAAVNMLSGSISYSYMFLILLKAAGVLVTGLLLWYLVDKNNPALKKICGNKKGSEGCKSILDAPASKLLKNLSWSEIGAFYFTGGLLALVLYPELINIVALFSLLAFPYTIYSIAYQRFIAKQWCTLCLSVQALLLLEVITVIAGHHLHSFLPSSNIALHLFHLIVSYAIPALLWYSSKHMLTGFVQNGHLKYELARLKKNPTIVSAILDKQKSIPASPEDVGIVIGNRNASHTIVTVSNPFCPPCAKTHLALDELLECNNVKAQLIFTASSDPADKKRGPVNHFLAIAEEGDESKTKRALSDWYEVGGKNYRSFVKKYELNGKTGQQDEKIRSMDEWCQATGISHTPTVYVDGRELPPTLNLEDLKYVFADER